MLNSFRQLFDRSEASLETQRQERFESLDTFIDSLSDREEEGAPPRLQELSDEVAAIVRLPQYRLTGEQFRMVKEDPESLRDQLRGQVDAYLTTLTINRVVGAMERRLGEALNIRANQFQDMDWPEITSQLLQAAEDLLERQFDRLLGEGKIIARDLDPSVRPVGRLHDR